MRVHREEQGPAVLPLRAARHAARADLRLGEVQGARSQRGLYGDVVEELDWSVGEILAALKKHGLDEQTLVIFTSDNGPFLSYGNHAGSAGPLREGS